MCLLMRYAHQFRDAGSARATRRLGIAELPSRRRVAWAVATGAVASDQSSGSIAGNAAPRALDTTRCAYRRSQATRTDDAARSAGAGKLNPVVDGGWLEAAWPRQHCIHSNGSHLLSSAGD